MITDDHSLLWLQNLKDPSGRLARWSLRLQSYDFEIIHRKGRDHIVPDALSRAIASINIQKFGATKDAWYLNIKKNFVENSQLHDNLKLENEVVYKKFRSKGVSDFE